MDWPRAERSRTRTIIPSSSAYVARGRDACDGFRNACEWRRSPKVAYWEPCKWAAKIRRLSTSNNPVFVKIGEWEQSAR